MTLKRILTLAAVVAVVAVAIVAYAFLRTPEEASEPIVAVPIATQAPAAATAAPTVEPQPPSPTPEPAEAVPTPSPEAAPAEPTPTAVVEAAASPTPEPAPASEPVVFEILQEGTEARFIIQEVLRGADTTVVGVTNQAAGQIAIDTANPANSQVGVIQVNARTLATDNNIRNRAIKNQILRTNDFEYVTFEPTEVRGMPASVLPGDTFSFQIAGDLTITDVTLPVVFEVTVTAVSDQQIKGLAETQILWRDFGLFIPDAPSVDTVEDSVILQLEFTAAPAA